MIKYYSISENKVVETAKLNATILHFVNPDDTEIKILINEYRLDEHTLISALDKDEIARLEFENDHAAIIFKLPKNYTAKQPLLFKVNSAGLFLFQDKLILISNEDNLFFSTKHFTKVSSLKETALILIDSAVDHFIDHLKTINNLSDEIETKINKAIENKYLIYQFTLSKSLVYFQDAINSNSFLLDRIKINAAKLGFNQQEIELLDDIIVECNQSYRQVEIFSNILTNMTDSKAAIINNNLNKLMKTLNIITITIMVPTFVVSVFSMNVAIPFQKNPNAFIIIMALALLSVLGFYMFWKFKKW